MKRKISLKFALAFLCGLLWSHNPLVAQNMELVGQKDPLKINGGLSVNQMAYVTSDSVSGRDPYSIYLNGNLNFNLYGWAVPFTFSYSNQKTTYTQPFNQYSLHPYYKWIKLHAGYTSMTFSPYTLNGHLFLGGGVELTPKLPITFSAMYGRLKKSIESDTSLLLPSPAEYERWGSGVKLGYNFSGPEYIKFDASVNAFHARDVAGSLNYVPDSTLVPAENIAIGGTLNATIVSHIKIQTEIAASAVTTNLETEQTDDSPKGWPNSFDGIFTNNSSTSTYNAFKLNGMYFNKNYSIGLGYERIDPGYNSFGAYYFNNDFENITVNGSLSLLENKVTLGANVGKQRDNLDNTKASKMNRWVMAFTLGFIPGEKLNANFSFSTFNSFMNIQPHIQDITKLTPYDNLDTLNYTQLSTTSSLNLSYQLKNNESTRQNINFNISYQQSSEKQDDTLVAPGSQFYNLNAAYSHSLVPLALTSTISLNASFNLMPGMNTKTFGPSVAVNKLLLNKKLRTSLMVSYNIVYLPNAPENGVFSARLNGSYRLGKRHNLNLGLTYMNRKRRAQEQVQKIDELIATLGYSFSF